MIAVRPTPTQTLAEAGDEMLIRQAQAGDRDAFGELYQRHRPAVLRYLHSKLRQDAADVEDVAAETFIAAMASIGRFRAGEAHRFASWLVGIARHKAMDHLERRQARCEVELPEDWPEDAVAPARGPEEQVCDRAEVERLLSELDPRSRQILALRFGADLDGAAVALALGLARSTIWTLTSRARAQLRGTPVPRSTREPLPPALCACGCGTSLPPNRRAGQRYLDRTHRDRAWTAARPFIQRRYLAGPVTEDPAVERVFAALVTSGPAGIARRALYRRTQLQAARLDRIVGLLKAQGHVYQRHEPSTGNRPIMRYFALSQPTTATRAA